MPPEAEAAAAAAEAATAAAAAAAAAAAETWHAKLPEDLRADPSLADFKDEAEMIPMPINVAKSFVHTKKMVGADTIKIPKTDEEFEEVYNKLGRPESGELYLLQQAEDVNPILQEAFAKDATWFRSTAHKLGLTDKQATELFREFTKQTSDRLNTDISTRDADGINTEIQLRTEYGTAYEGNKILSQRAMQELGGSEFMDLINSTGVSKHPAFVRAMFKVGNMMAEDLGLDRQTGQLIKTKSTVQEEIAHLQSHKGYTDAKHPEHTTLVNKVAVLMQQLHGTKAIPISSGELTVTA